MFRAAHTYAHTCTRFLQCPYWYNTLTQESRYDNPFEAAAADAGQAGGYSSAEGYGSEYYGAEGYGTDAANGGDGGGEWQEYYDDASGAPYWVSSTTGETVWENPNGGGGGGGGDIGAEGYDDSYYQGAEGYDTAGADGGSGYVQYYGDDGTPYWFNEATGDTTYEDPGW